MAQDATIRRCARDDWASISLSLALTGTWLKNSTNGTLNSHQYTYNPGNHRTQQVFNAGSTYNYTYDPIGQLKIADSATSTEDRGYTYDAAWNLNYRTNNTTTWTFTVNTKNELTNAFSSPYTYDGNGNMSVGNSWRNNYLYDDENRLVQWFNYYNPNGYPLMSGDQRHDFVYDGLSRLRSRSEYQWSGSSWYPYGTTYYIYDGMRVIQERTGSPTVSYTRGNDLSGSLEGAGGIGGLLARSHGYSSGNWITHNFYHADGNGNITYLVNNSQTLAASYRYDPYGNTISSSGTVASANVYRFSSKEFHANSGLYYYGYRFYSPSLQRWLSRDPIEEKGGLNLYGFVRNNPFRYVDPLGLLPPGGYPDWGGPPLPPPLQGPTIPSKGNCWRYACNDPAKPGEDRHTHPAGPRLTPTECRYTCDDIMNGARKKGALDPGPNGKCPDGYYMIKAVVMDQRGKGGVIPRRMYYDYHWYRQNDDGSWSGKPGIMPVDPNISDPTADAKKHGYDKDCGNLCVPNNGLNTD